MKPSTCRQQYGESSVGLACLVATCFEGPTNESAERFRRVSGLARRLARQRSGRPLCVRTAPSVPLCSCRVESILSPRAEQQTQTECLLVLSPVPSSASASSASLAVVVVGQLGINIIMMKEAHLARCAVRPASPASFYTAPAPLERPEGVLCCSAVLSCSNWAPMQVRRCNRRLGTAAPIIDQNSSLTGALSAARMQISRSRQRHSQLVAPPVQSIRAAVVVVLAV